MKIEQPKNTEKQKPKSGMGGARPGSGRKKGYLTQRSRELAAKSLEKGISPLEVMLEAVRIAYEEGGAVNAFQYAAQVAPFVHPRLSTTSVSGTDGKPLFDKIEIILVGAKTCQH